MRGQGRKYACLAELRHFHFFIIITYVLAVASSASCQQDSKSDLPQTAPQVNEALSFYEGQNVVAIDLSGKPGLDEQSLKPLLAQKEKEPFAMAKVTQSVAELKQRENIKEVEIEVRPQAEGVRLIFVLQPAYYFGIYTFPGSGRFPYSRLLQVSEYPPRGAYSDYNVNHARDLLVHFFQQSGYFQAKVVPEVQIDSAHGLVNMAFHVTLNRQARFGKVVFEGAPPELEPKLQSALKSYVARLRGVAIRSGKSYSYRTVQKAPDYLESKLIDLDYLGSRVEKSGVEYDPETNRADVHFKVTGGERVHVKIVGAHLWSWTRHRLLPMYAQAGLDPEIITEGRENLISYFQSKGYFDVRVSNETRATNTGEQIVYQIAKGRRNKVKSVEIAGNRTLSDAELRGHIKIEKASFVPFLSHGKFSDQLVRESVKNVERVYQAAGFSDVKVTPDIERASGEIVARFVVQENQRDIVANLRLEGNQVPVEKLAPKGLEIAAGEPYSAKRVDDDRNHVMAQYLRMGYPNADFRATASKVNNNPHRLDVTYHITEGPRVSIDSVITLGAQATRQSLIDRTVRLKPEYPLREDEIFAAESRLYNLGVFDWAEIDPRRQITTQKQEDILVKVHEARQNEIRYGFGFEVINRGGNIPGGTVAVPGLPPVGLPSTFKTSERTFWGPRGTFQYERRNLRGLGETVTIGLLGARLDQRAAISYADPYFLGATWDSIATLAIERNSENPIFTSRFGDFQFQVRRVLNAAGNKTLSLRYDFRRTSLADLLIPDLVPPEDRNIHLSTLAAAYSFDTRDNPLDATRGMYQTADFDISVKPLGSSVNFARLRGQLARYKSLGGGIVWANSLRIGLAQALAGSHVPVSELFFSGGGSTLRGFPLNGAGPQRTIPVCGNPADPTTCTQIQAPNGGRELFIVNSEFRFPLPIKKGLGLVTFYDGGNVFPSVGFRHFGPNYSNTLGIGFRYKTPVGPVRVDIGHNLNAPPGLKPTQIFITLGQAF